MKSISVRKKLILGFTSVTAAAVALGVIALMKLFVIGSAARFVIENNLPHIVGLNETRYLAQRNYLDCLHRVLTEDTSEQKRIEQDCAERDRDIVAHIQYIEETIGNDADREHSEKLRRFHGPFAKSCAAALRLAHDGQLNEARTLLEKETGPAFEALAKALNESVESEVGEGTQAGAGIESEVQAGINTIYLSIPFALIAGIAVGYLINRSITRPLAHAVTMVDRVAAGDLRHRVTVISQDEIGRICTSLNTMADRLSGSISSITQNSHELDAVSHDLNTLSSEAKKNAEETAAQSNVVASAAEEISKSVATVATSSEQMSATVKEIAQQASEAARIASQASEAAARTNTTIVKLGESSSEIGNVVNVITSIAEQTNLLALNATIEAARAGEAGRGFAVVANEVKELAKQTARATSEIRDKIIAIQTDSTDAVNAIREIAGVIQKINQIQTLIASSVEEQAATMNEISGNASEASRGAAEIAQNIASVSEAAQGSTSAATRAGTASDKLTQLAAQLNSATQHFQITPDRATADDPELRPILPITAGAASSRKKSAARTARPTPVA